MQLSTNKNNITTVSPTQLLVKLENLKASNYASNNKVKQIKQFQEQLQFYEQYCLSCMQRLQNKIQKLNLQISQTKKCYKKTQNIAIKKFDDFQRLLEKTLNQYQNQRKQGEKMIINLTRRIQQQFQRLIHQKTLNSNQLLQSYMYLNNRLQQIISSLRSMQDQLISRYNGLRKQFNTKFQTLQQRLLCDLKREEKQGMLLLNRLQEMERGLEEEIQKLNERKEKKRVELHEMMEKMIEEVVEKDHDSVNTSLGSFLHS